MVVTNARTAEKVSCESFWKESDVVIYFMRRFGCPLCRWISHELYQIHSELESNNVKLIAIAPEKFGLDEFLEGNFFPGDIFLDETKEAYEALEFTRFSLMGSLGAAIDGDTRKMVSEAKKIGITGNIKGDTRQLGGLLIVREGGKDLTYHKQVKAADYVKNSEILKTLGISVKAPVVDTDQPENACPIQMK